MSDRQASNEAAVLDRLLGLYQYCSAVVYLPGFRKNAPKRNVLLFIVYVQLLLLSVSLVHLLL